MTKTELYSAVAHKLGMEEKDTGKIAKIINGALDVIAEQLAVGDRVTLTEFGTFIPTEVAERKCRSPQTGKMITCKKHIRVRFKTGAVLKRTVNEQK